MNHPLLVYGMIYAGSAVMLLNIILYVLFCRQVVRYWKLKSGARILLLLLVLLVLFLAGYLAVGIFGRPDVIMAGILFGGSIFVLVVLWVMRRLTVQIREAENLEAALRSAEKANASKTVFLSNMSHEL